MYIISSIWVSVFFFLSLSLLAQEGPNLTELVQEYIRQMSPPVALQWRALATAASLAPIQIGGTLSSHDFARDQQRLVQVSYMYCNVMYSRTLNNVKVTVTIEQSISVCEEIV